MQMYLALAALFPSVTVADVSAGTGSVPIISANIGLGINLAYVGGSSPDLSDVIEAKFDSMLNSGMMASLLASKARAGSPAPTRPAHTQSAAAFISHRTHRYRSERMSRG